MTDTHQQNERQLPSIVSTIGDLLAPARLDRLIALHARGSSVTPKAQLLEQTVELLSWLKQPGINTTLGAMLALKPSEAAIVNDVALAMFAAGPRRPKVMAEFRALLERGLS